MTFLSAGVKIRRIFYVRTAIRLRRIIIVRAAAKQTNSSEEVCMRNVEGFRIVTLSENISSIESFSNEYRIPDVMNQKSIASRREL